ncbi:Disease resistance protein [Arachis hypogaea]|uniref:Disease resistance protein n=1 Tax=Arachis hypogaea TaxID=3818 RepID=A0A6B9V4D7_ARAHY|nr:Disease resistance protein [Arachis hypogaea]QHN76217.1 Disease resistance protein [Arachis hypogaea]
MNFEDSLKLFSHNAFCDSHPKEDYYELSTRVVADYAKGIPLALNILGSFLRTKEKSEWDSALRKLRKYPNADIQQVLRLSYDALDDDEKNILLDIACFFHDHEMKKITRILKSCGFYADIGIKSLLDKSLVSIYSNGRDECIKMHSLIQEMCRKIIHEESSKNGGRQIRLWNTEEVCNIFQNERDIYGVESMIVDMNEITIDPRIIIIALRKMPKLRLLALRGNINMDLEGNRVLVEDFQLPNDLRYIEWDKCPLKFVRSIPWPQKLVQLSMPDSNVQKLWDTPQNLPSLEIIDLRGCKRLIECPNLAGATNLKLISLYGCESLQDVHPSIFSLPKIQNLYVNFCTSLKRLCSGYCSPSLCTLWAIGCCNLEEFSIPIMSDHSNLTLILPSTALTEVPSTIMHLKNLEWFGFNISYSLQKLPLNFASKISLKDPIKHEDDTCIMLSRILPTPAFLSLKQLSFFECKSLSKLPDNIHVLQSLQLLHLQSCHVITSLPKSIKNLQQLMGLVIMDCKMLQYVPPLPPSIIYFKALNCKSLETLSSLTSEPPRQHNAWFAFHNCTKLDDDAYEAVLKDLKSRIELVANNDGYSHNEANNDSPFFYYYLPSKESIINEWFPDYYSREASIIVEVAPDHKISSCLVGCILISQYQSFNFGVKKVIFGWKCYLGKGCNEWEWIATSANRGRLTGSNRPKIVLKMVSDHKVVWYDGEPSNKIMEAIKERKRDSSCNTMLKFEFYANIEDNEEVVIKGCGIRWMHVHVNHEGQISPDATHEGYESHDVERQRTENPKKSIFASWFQRLLEVSSLTSEPPRKHNAWFGFHNCTKLDDDAYDAVLEDFKSRIKLVANNDGYSHNEANNGNIFFYYYLPSKESIINEWFPDYYSREASIIVEVAPDHKISSCLVGCILISQYQSCKLVEKEVIFGWKCYLGKGCNEWEWITTFDTRKLLTGSCYVPDDVIDQLEMVSDHKVVWYHGEPSKKITEAIKERRKGTSCNTMLKFEFYANTEDNEEVVIKGCGIRWMHVHVNHQGEISPDATHDVESQRTENQRKSGFTSWFQRLLCYKANTEEEI